MYIFCLLHVGLPISPICKTFTFPNEGKMNFSKWRLESLSICQKWPHLLLNGRPGSLNHQSDKFSRPCVLFWGNMKHWDTNWPSDGSTKFADLWAWHTTKKYFWQMDGFASDMHVLFKVYTNSRADPNVGDVFERLSLFANVGCCITCTLGSSSSSNIFEKLKYMIKQIRTATWTIELAQTHASLQPFR